MTPALELVLVSLSSLCPCDVEVLSVSAADEPGDTAGTAMLNNSSNVAPGCSVYLAEVGEVLSA